MSLPSHGKNNSETPSVIASSAAGGAKQSQVEIKKLLFKSSFKKWIRIVSFILVAVFLSQQVSWAKRNRNNYADLGELFKKPSLIDAAISLGSTAAGIYFAGPTNLIPAIATNAVEIGGALVFKDDPYLRLATSTVAGFAGGGFNGRGLSFDFSKAGIGAAKGLVQRGAIEGFRAAKLNPAFGYLAAVPLGQAMEAGLASGFNVQYTNANGKSLYNSNDGFLGGAWKGLTLQSALATTSWERWKPAIGHFGGQALAIAFEEIGPKKFRAVYSQGVSTIFSGMLAGEDSWAKGLGKAFAAGIGTGIASLGLRKMTSNLSPVQAGGLGMLASAGIGAGVESIFGKGAVSALAGSPTRWGIFKDRFMDTLKTGATNIVTFGSSTGPIRGPEGAMAFTKIMNLADDVRLLKGTGLSPTSALYRSWNQYVGATLHFSALSNVGQVVSNRIDGVKYGNVGADGGSKREIHPFRPISSGVGNSWQDLKTGEIYHSQVKEVSAATMPQIKGLDGVEISQDPTTGRRILISREFIGDTGMKTNYNPEDNTYNVTFPDESKVTGIAELRDNFRGQKRILEGGKTVFIDPKTERATIYSPTGGIIRYDEKGEFESTTYPSGAKTIPFKGDTYNIVGRIKEKVPTSSLTSKDVIVYQRLDPKGNAIEWELHDRQGALIGTVKNTGEVALFARKNQDRGLIFDLSPNKDSNQHRVVEAGDGTKYFYNQDLEVTKMILPNGKSKEFAPTEVPSSASKIAASPAPAASSNPPWQEKIEKRLQELSQKAPDTESAFDWAKLQKTKRFEEAIKLPPPRTPAGIETVNSVSQPPGEVRVSKDDMAQITYQGKPYSVPEDSLTKEPGGGYFDLNLGANDIPVKWGSETYYIDPSHLPKTSPPPSTFLKTDPTKAKGAGLNKLFNPTSGTSESPKKNPGVIRKY